MHVLVIHASALGSTKDIAEWIGQALRDKGVMATVAAAGAEGDPRPYDAFVIGSAVHGGHWLRSATDVLERHLPILSERPVWLFSSGPVGDRAVGALGDPKVSGADGEPAEVRELRGVIDIRDHIVFAGSFDRATADLARLGILDRMVAKRFLPSGDWRDRPLIEAWASVIARTILGRLAMSPA